MYPQRAKPKDIYDPSIPRATGPMNDLDVICRGSGSVASFERYTNWLPQQPSVAQALSEFQFLPRLPLCNAAWIIGEA